MFQYDVPIADRIYSGSHMSFLVLGRSLIQSFEATVPWVVISITDPDKPDAEITPSPFLRDVLRLKFHDCKPSIVVPGCIELTDVT